MILSTHMYSCGAEPRRPLASNNPGDIAMTTCLLGVNKSKISKIQSGIDPRGAMGYTKPKAHLHL